MSWRVVTRVGKAPQEVIDPADWEHFTTEQQNGFASVSLFGTEQEADKFAIGQVEASKPARPKPPKR